MGRRYRPQKTRGSAADDLMAWYLKDRARTDARIDADLERSCTSKQQYASEADAHAHALMNGMGNVLYSYECRYCGFWHLTRRPT
ncbi:MAG TPA: hypothetical protein VMD91_09920 [Candidatus Sulfotelmatobacter sp.]|nr:hypothetical protein [Candidatus Sulfotelmatobacter sp.]